MWLGCEAEGWDHLQWRSATPATPPIMSKKKLTKVKSTVWFDKLRPIRLFFHPRGWTLALLNLEVWFVLRRPLWLTDDPEGRMQDTGGPSIPRLSGVRGGGGLSRAQFRPPFALSMTIFNKGTGCLRTRILSTCIAGDSIFFHQQAEPRFAKL